jgi:hypothetical protein
MVFSHFAVYYRDNHARVVPFFESCMGAIHNDKIWYNPYMIIPVVHSKTAENHLLFSNSYGLLHFVVQSSS